MFNSLFKKVYFGEHLDANQSRDAMNLIMEGKATPVLLGAFLTALHLKGETPEEIASFAQIMREKSLGIEYDGELLDTCGTGGDQKNLFNISTATALTVAACGVKVAKHGNKAVSSPSGSADILSKLGVNINLDAGKVKRCIDELGLGFLFAPGFHPAMKHVGPIRMEMGVRTVFNILGPLSNPFRAKYQILGVFDHSLIKVMINVLKLLKTKSAIVLHSEDGMDEISIFSKTKALYFMDYGDIHEITIDPAKYKMIHSASEMEQIQVKDQNDSLKIFQEAINGKNPIARDMVVINSAVALWIRNHVNTIEQGIEMVSEKINNGNVEEFLANYIQLTNSMD